MRFSLRSLKLTVSAATGASLLAAVGVVAWGLQSPAVSPRGNHASDARHESVANSAEEQLPELTRDGFAQLCEQPLRRPLYDPPPPKPVVRQLPPLRVELLGTILEGDNSIAIIRSEQGKVEYRRIGDSVGPVDGLAQLVEIQGDAVLLERAEERITLQVQGSERR